jgi:hypothetical protein
VCSRKLVLHPGDNSQRNDKGHVSLYLQIAETKNYSNGWKVNVNFKLFVYDQIHKNYLTIQGIYIYTTYIYKNMLPDKIKSLPENINLRTNNKLS